MLNVFHKLNCWSMTRSLVGKNRDHCTFVQLMVKKWILQLHSDLHFDLVTIASLFTSFTDVVCLWYSGGTGSVLFEVVPTEKNTSVKEAKLRSNCFKNRNCNQFFGCQIFSIDHCGTVRSIFWLSSKKRLGGGGHDLHRCPLQYLKHSSSLLAVPFVAIHS